MKIAIIADSYSPMKTSAAVQLHDLTSGLIERGHSVTMIVADSELESDWASESVNEVDLLRLRVRPYKDIRYAKRIINEFLMPFSMKLNFNKTPFSNTEWNAVLWYSPTIFLGPFARYLKVSSRCPGYLILRDVFPDWASDLGIIRHGPAYWFLKAVARYQYSIADIIGVQAKGNLKYFDYLKQPHKKIITVLNNWLSEPKNIGCTIQIEQTKLKGRTIFVYAGNMGIAQGMDILISLAIRLQHLNDVGFVFVGRGKYMQRLQGISEKNNLENILFFNEISPDEIAGLYSQCHIGLVALDRQHKSHNIPGKFLSYLMNGLPVLANVNANNELVEIIKNEKIGRVCSTDSIDELVFSAVSLLNEIDEVRDLGMRCVKFAQSAFSVESTIISLEDEIRNFYRGCIR